VQVCWTFLAIGYTVTTVEEPMAVFGMFKESRIYSIGERARLQWFTFRALSNVRCGNWKNIESKIRIFADDCII
jgi:hypothetical protein